MQGAYRTALAALLYRVENVGGMRLSQIPKKYHRLVIYGISHGYLYSTPLPHGDWIIERSHRSIHVDKSKY